MSTETAPKIFDYRNVDKADEFEEIPVLDMGPYLAGEPGAAEELAANIRFIQETIGFYVVIRSPNLVKKIVDNA